MENTEHHNCVGRIFWFRFTPEYKDPMFVVLEPSDDARHISIAPVLDDPGLAVEGDEIAWVHGAGESDNRQFVVVRALAGRVPRGHRIDGLEKFRLGLPGKPFEGPSSPEALERRKRLSERLKGLRQNPDILGELTSVLYRPDVEALAKLSRYLG